MTEPSRGHNLGYGHVGGIFYDGESQTWLSRRQLRGRFSLNAVGNTEKYVDASLSLDAGSFLTEPARSKRVRDLMRNLPELQPAEDVVAEYLKEVTATASVLAESKGNILATGYAHNPFGSDVPILAIPSGSDGSTVRVIEMQYAMRGWKDDSGTWLETVDLRNSKTASWKGDGSPITQICSSSTMKESYTLLAVRSPTYVKILRPALRMRRKRRGKLELQSVMSIDMRPSSYEPCADIMFNDWNTQQLAAVDQKGRWIVWNIDDTTSCAKFLQAGVMDTFELNGGSADQDTWHRIIWILSGQALALCARTHLQLFSASGSSLGIIHLLKRPDERIFNVVKRPSCDGDLFILTSSNLFFIRVDTQGGWRVLVSWKHYRDENDCSLKVFVHDTDEGSSVIIYSRQSSLATCYHVPTSVEEPFQRAEMNPSRLEWIKSTPSDLCFMDAPMRSRKTGDLGLSALLYQSKNLRFVQAFVLDADLSLRGHLCYASSSAESERDTIVDPPSWEDRREKYTHEEANTPKEEDAFHLGIRERAVSQRSRAAARRRNPLAFTVPNEIVCEKLSDFSTRPGIEIQHVLHDIVQKLRMKAGDEELHLQTLDSLETKAVEVDDIDNASTLASRLLESYISSTGSAIFVRQLAAPRLLGLPSSSKTDSQVTLHSIYRHLTSLWLSPLPPRVGSSIRLARERVARRLAASLFLAAYGATGSPTETWHSPPPRQGVAGSSQNQDPPSSLDHDFSTLQLTGDTAATQPANFGFIENSVRRLRQYTSFANEPSSTTAAESRALQEVLAHWTVGADPSAYSYAHTVALLSEGTGRGSLVEGSALSAERLQHIERQREKEAAREERRRIKRQKRGLGEGFGVKVESSAPGEASSAFDAGMASSQVSNTPSGVDLSATMRNERPWMSSQPVGVPLSSPVVQPQTASQVEPGRFGARTPLAAQGASSFAPSSRATDRKREKRKAGFN